MLELVGFHAAIAQLVERIHGKDEVSGSSPDRGSKLDPKIWRCCRLFCLFVIVYRRQNHRNQLVGFFLFFLLVLVVDNARKFRGLTSAGDCEQGDYR